jgi:hypothetical protein
MWKLPGPDFAPETSYPYYGTSRFSLVLSGRCASTIFFQMHFSSLLINRPTIQRYVINVIALLNV